MSWPTGSDYQDAIQNPSICFEDPELKDGRVVADALGLPRPISGSFATVFQIDSNGIKHAVRCFRSQYPEIEKRYSVISEYLKHARLPYLVEFAYINKGILVKGQRYPILKMEWAPGEPLNLYVEHNLRNPQALFDLSSKFLKLCADLRQAGIAHGDLQHGNILVSGGYLRLVDYDGMYVPGLAGMPSNELGHRNYQHPARTAKDFGPFIDNFSEWVIYLSIAALALGIQLPPGVGTSGDSLLFLQQDFKRPESSSTLLMLEQSPELTLQSLTSLFLSYLHVADISQIPPPDDAMVSLLIPPTPIPVPVGTNPIPGPSWVIDHLGHGPPQRISEPLRTERLTLIGVALACTMLALASLPALVPPMAAAFIANTACTVAGILLAAMYHRIPEVSAKRKLAREFDAMAGGIHESQGHIQRLSQGLAKLDSQQRQAVEAIHRRQTELGKKQDAEAKIVERELAGILSGIDSKRHRVQDAQSNEEQHKLRELQQSMRYEELRKNDIANANLPGIGNTLKQRLIANGIRTAADVVDIKIVSRAGGRWTRQVAYITVPGRGNIAVEGIGPAKAQAIQVWLNNIQYNMQSKLPTSLPPATGSLIARKYDLQLQELNQQRAKAMATCKVRTDSIAPRYQQEREALTKELQAVPNKFDAERLRLNREIGEKSKELGEKQFAMASLQKQLESYVLVNPVRYLTQIATF